MISITLDNASTNLYVIALLQTRLFVIIKYVFHIKYDAHIVNLVVKDGTDLFNSNIDEIENAIF